MQLRENVPVGNAGSGAAQPWDPEHQHAGAHTALAFLVMHIIPNLLFLYC